jgi:transcriptional regulator with XRE-family HTH domain
MTSWATPPLTTELWMKHLNETDADSVSLAVPIQTECLETSAPQNPRVSRRVRAGVGGDCLRGPASPGKVIRGRHDTERRKNTAIFCQQSQGSRSILRAVLRTVVYEPYARGVGVFDRHCHRPGSLRSVVDVDRKEEIRDFLISRRAKITPEQAGIPSYGELRRVPGLRREEVAQLAGVSTDYYTRLERGSIRGVSDSVLEAVAAALQLDEAERAHLLDLARTANTPSRRTPRRPPQQRVRPGVLRLLDGMTGAVAMVQNTRSDVLAANLLARALYAPVFESAAAVGRDAPGSQPNQARYVFLDPGAGDFYPDWPAVAATTVAMLRSESGRSPHDRALDELVGELATRSGLFASLWAGHDVRIHTTGTKRFHHPVAGDLSLQFETLHLPGDEGQTLFTFTAEPGSASANALAFLASWAASPPETTTASHHAGGPTTPARSHAQPGTRNPGKTEPTHD